MFPQFRERMGSALDLIVEFSTLGEYRLAANGAVCPASALTPALRKRGAPERREPPQLGGAGVSTAERAAVRRIVAGGAAGLVPAATPAARRGAEGRCGERRRTVKAAAPEQLCLAI